MLEAGKFRLCAQEGEDGADGGIRAGDGAVDPLMREQQRTLHAVLLAERKQGLAQAFEARKGNEMIERGNEECAGRVAPWI